MSEKRTYRLKKRAKAQEETRRRIVEATMRLHEGLGPRATTISAIAEKAGVQRLTVYRHFPDETAVFKACTSRWLSLNPPPDPIEWANIENPEQRLRAAMRALYTYYAKTRRMWTGAHRDVDDVPALQEPMEAFGAYIAEIGDDLIDRYAPSSRSERLTTTIQHALMFPTWSDLEARGLSEPEKVELVVCWARGVTSRS